MKLKTQDLIEALNHLKPVISRRATLPILSCVKIHAERNRLHLTASDLDQYQVEKIECDGECEPFCVNFEHFFYAIGGEFSELKLGKEALTVTCDFGVTKLSTLGAEEFPSPPKCEGLKKVGVSCADLAKAINLVSFAASVDPGQYVICSVRIESKAKQLAAAATNGRELALVEMGLIGSDFSATIPVSFCANAASVLECDGAVLSVCDNHISVEHESSKFYAKQVDGNYPNFRQVIPSKITKIGEVDVAAFRELVGRCLNYAVAKEAKGIFTFSKTGVQIDFAGQNNTTLSHNLPGQFSDFEIALNTRAIHNSLSHMKEERATLFHAGDNLSPITIQAGDLKILTMPMRT